ncbi:S1C family serine protease [Sphingobium algorifonticola]|uniref:Serine protease n=1 Tax=Sphingobium algorifonticola TaxID=2008318 RepID=A0A437JBK3_9SPHN|nr:trypsin-like peptidase domain-containing protein [Sphingobium algorifonticola]RVT43255.1 serine protease [Sphingobium algorifonticola]
MTSLLRRIAAILILTGFAATARADQMDLTAAARSVVRVALVASNGAQAYFVGHGSGLVVAPDKVLTNAHVVELARDEKDIVIGIVPSEGKKSYGGRIIAYSPGNDLALIQMEDGRLPPGSFYAGAIADGQHVTAIGYPGTVDRAQGLGLKDMVEPMIAVKTGGNISSGRSGKAFDTLLHTAPLASGNSGGPLVDDCGRVLGLNSFGSISDGNDAEFGFAVSNREIASFLRQAGVTFLRTSAPCRSLADIDEAEAQRVAALAAKQDAATRASSEAQAAALAKAREAAEQDIIAARENMMALAAVLLALAVLAAGAAGLNYTQGKQKPTLWFGIGGGALLVGALAIFLLRPSFSGIEDRVARTGVESGAVTTIQTIGYDATGDNLCRIDEGRSRITVSPTTDVPLNWTATGCANGKRQYRREGEEWIEVASAPDDAAITVTRFDPATGALRSERYLVDADTLERARAIRARTDAGACTSDASALAGLARMQNDLRALLPLQPNERLVYQCGKGIAAP